MRLFLKRHIYTLHEEVAIKPTKVVKEHWDERRLLKVQVTIRTGGSSELSRYMAMISNFTRSITEDIATNCTVGSILKVYLVLLGHFQRLNIV